MAGAGGAVRAVGASAERVQEGQAMAVQEQRGPSQGYIACRSGGRMQAGTWARACACWCWGPSLGLAFAALLEHCSQRATELAIKLRLAVLNIADQRQPERLRCEVGLRSDAVAWWW